MPKVHVIVDMQFGSTGKGLLAGYLAETRMPDTVVAAWGPNAGHTYVDRQGRKYVHTMLPNGFLSPRVERIMLGPASVINPDALSSELIQAEATSGLSILDKLYIHENAAIVRPEHKEREAVFQRIGSTSKGTAEAIIEKLRRDPAARVTAKQDRHQLGWGLSDRVVTADEYDRLLDKAFEIQCEGAQGFSLGLNQRFYPYCTSRDCTAQQVLVDCGIPRSYPVEVYGTLRTYPIRVANRFNSKGEMVGTSGPWYQDQREITFADIGQPQELTTVTKLPRRIFTFSLEQLRAACRANAPKHLFVNFMNYLPREQWADFVAKVTHVASEFGSEVRWLSDGPAYENVWEA